MVLILFSLNQKNLPNKAFTPGVVRTSNAKEICAKDFRTKAFRKTTDAMKHEVCRKYHVAHCPNWPAMELDHLLPLELGGSDEVANLWPEFAPSFHDKDKLENFLHKQVCTGKMTLPAAQKCIISNWIECKKKAGI